MKPLLFFLLLPFLVVWYKLTWNCLFILYNTFTCRFSSGIEVAAFVTSCQTLCKSWGVISSRYEGITSNEGVKLSWKVYKEPGSDLTVIAFEDTPDSSSNLQPDLVSSSDLKQKAFLQFMCTKNNPVLSLNNTAVSLFCENHQNLDQLKSEVSLFSDGFWF